MRSGRNFVALCAACRFAARGVCPQEKSATSLCASAVMSHTTRCLYLSSVLRTAAETCLGGSNINNTNNNTDDNNTDKGNNNNKATGRNDTALDVAMRVNKLKRLHQTGGGPDGKKRIELDAWNELNSLTEEQINVAEGKEVSLLLNSWAYFAKYWDKGRDGPMGAATSLPTGTQAEKTSKTTPQQDNSKTA